MWQRRTQPDAAIAADEPPAETAAPARARRSRPGYFERRRQRRRRRVMFEEILGWVMVPALIYGGYLVYRALGGFPPGTFDFLSEMASLALRGGK